MIITKNTYEEINNGILCTLICQDEETPIKTIIFNKDLLKMMQEYDWEYVKNYNNSTYPEIVGHKNWDDVLLKDILETKYIHGLQDADCNIFDCRIENEDYLKSQILTYMGNKRSLLKNICTEIELIQDEYQKEKFRILDLFSGSGIVARALKKYSSELITNDLEPYSAIINDCYLSNHIDFNESIYTHYAQLIIDKTKTTPIKNIICQNYAPVDSFQIKDGERAFYTAENACLIDSYRKYIDEIVPKDYKKYFLARLLIEASIHTNTSGIFKGFYKDKNTGIGKFGGTAENALERINSPIDISTPPVLSTFNCNTKIFTEDANTLIKHLDNVDIAYLDPPYNQHPYGSNYFMLNTILDNKLGNNLSKISGIPDDWKHSNYNNKKTVLESMEDLISNIKAHYLIISYNNEGFISKSDMETMLCKYGKLKTVDIKYVAFRGSRNLKNRNINTIEYLYVLNKEEN